MSISGRIVLIGETQVGKTSLIQKYLRGQVSPEQKSTIGAVFHTHEVTVDNKTVQMQIWDTAGQERYRALGPIYYRKSNAAIAVFDVTRKETMEALEGWIKNFRENADDTYVIIAANKSDMEDDQIQVTLDETLEFAQKFDAECIWTSAMSGIGINDLFDAIIKQLVLKSPDETPCTLDLKKEPEQSKSSCC